MLKTKLLFLIIMISIVLVCQNPPETIWTQTFGGPGIEFVNSVKTTLDGGIILAGYTNSFGNGSHDAWLIKTDGNGVEEWNRTFGGRESDKARAVLQTVDGDFVISGYTASNGAGLRDVWLFKTDEFGNLIWEQLFGGSDSDEAFCMQQTSGGGYILAGYTVSFGYNGSIWVIKTDIDGEMEWEHSYGASYGTCAFSIAPTSDNGYIITGDPDTSGGNNGDYWLLKIDEFGIEEWYETFGGNNGDYWLLKIDEFGIEEWYETFGGNLWDGSCEALSTSDNGYIVAGYSYSFGIGQGDIWVLKTDLDGNLIWDQTYGGVNSDGAFCLFDSNDDGFLIAGYTFSWGMGEDDCWLIKIDQDGNEEWNLVLGGNDFEEAHTIAQYPNGDFIMGGYTLSYGAGNMDIWLVRLSTNSICDENQISDNALSASCFPNPFNPHTTIRYNITKPENVTIDVYNLKGQIINKIRKNIHQSGIQQISWDSRDFSGNDVPSGVYFYKIKTATAECTGKMVLLK